MPPAGSKGNGRIDRLEEALASLAKAQGDLVQAQASLVQSHALLEQNMTAFLARMAESDARMAKFEARMAETDRINAERFARIEAILAEHGRILRALPETIREKIGFKSPPAQSAGS